MLGLGDVKDDRFNAGRPDGVAITIASYASQDVESPASQFVGGCRAQARGGSGHDDQLLGFAARTRGHCLLRHDAILLYATACRKRYDDLSPKPALRERADAQAVRGAANGPGKRR
ncbi:hypothetical protein ABZ780_29365 [Micromonospora sp. NPDC047467]|uniref:hypothetical protein n=1 Tax=Micromonospora sp. NPDC047467 TaxID=3154814 RepID=UPI00340C2AD8